MNDKIRQIGLFLRRSRLALGNLWKTLDVRVNVFAFVINEWGKTLLEQKINDDRTHLLLTNHLNNKRPIIIGRLCVSFAR